MPAAPCESPRVRQEGAKTSKPPPQQTTKTKNKKTPPPTKHKPKLKHTTKQKMRLPLFVTPDVPFPGFARSKWKIYPRLPRSYSTMFKSLFDDLISPPPKKLGWFFYCLPPLFAQTLFISFPGPLFPSAENDADRVIFPRWRVVFFLPTSMAIEQ